MPPLSPADELAQIRAHLARLKAREAALVSALCAAPEVARRGRWTRAEVLEHRVRLFDHRLLPPPIREDPLFWRESVVLAVECHDLVPAQLSGGAARAEVHPLQ